MRNAEALLRAGIIKKLNDGVREEIEKQGLNLIGVVPHSDDVYELDCEGEPTSLKLPKDSPVRSALIGAVEKLLN